MHTTLGGASMIYHDTVSLSNSSVLSSASLPLNRPLSVLADDPISTPRSSL
jgi:hypothetical protein